MSSQAKTYLKFGGATVVILLLLGYLAYTGVQDSKSYYVTIKELHKMGDGAYSKRLRVAGNVQPGSIKRVGTHVQFVLMEEDQTLHVDYTGTARHFQRRFPGAGRREIRPRWCVSCQAAAGQVRVKVRSAAARHAG
jgi:cytochrome c-type biogenesis protein CcmE